MANSDNYQLLLKDFENNISTTWKSLRNEEDFCDVTLVCGESQIKAHKVILAACSPIFRNMLVKNPHQHPLLYLRGVSYQELCNMMDFIYQGEVKIQQDQLNNFLDAAKDLKIQGLTEDEMEKEQEQDKQTTLPVNNYKTWGHGLEESKDDPGTESKYGIQNIGPSAKRKRPTIELPKKVGPLSAILQEAKTKPLVKKEPKAASPTLVSWSGHNAPILQKVHSDKTKKSPQNGEQYFSGFYQDTLEETLEETLPQTFIKESSDGNNRNATFEEDISFTNENSSNQETSSKPSHACNDCYYKTSRKGNLKIHIESIHSGVTYSCDQCDYKANRRGNLKTHVEAIHDQVRISCEECSDTFTRKTYLKKHKIKEHGGSPSEERKNNTETITCGLEN